MLSPNTLMEWTPTSTASASPTRTGPRLRCRLRRERYPVRCQDTGFDDVDDGRGVPLHVNAINVPGQTASTSGRLFEGAGQSMLSRTMFCIRMCKETPSNWAASAMLPPKWRASMHSCRSAASRFRLVRMTCGIGSLSPQSLNPLLVPERIR